MERSFIYLDDCKRRANVANVSNFFDESMYKHHEINETIINKNVNLWNVDYSYENSILSFRTLYKDCFYTHQHWRTIYNWKEMCSYWGNHFEVSVPLPQFYVDYLLSLRSRADPIIQENNNWSNYQMFKTDNAMITDTPEYFAYLYKELSFLKASKKWSTPYGNYHFLPGIVDLHLDTHKDPYSSKLSLINIFHDNLKMRKRELWGFDYWLHYKYHEINLKRNLIIRDVIRSISRKIWKRHWVETLEYKYSQPYVNYIYLKYDFLEWIDSGGLKYLSWNYFKSVVLNYYEDLKFEWKLFKEYYFK